MDKKRKAVTRKGRVLKRNQPTPTGSAGNPTPHAERDGAPEPIYFKRGVSDFADLFQEFLVNHNWGNLKGECSILRAQLEIIADAFNNEIDDPNDGLFPAIRKFVPLVNSTIFLIDKLTRTNAFLETARPSVPVSAVKGLIKKILSAQSYAFTSTENDPQKIREFNERFLQFLGEDGLHVEDILRTIEAEDEN